jgi:hypothetical protein
MTLTVNGGELTSASPTLEDYPIILRGSKGKIREREPAALYALACYQGWPNTCGRAEAHVIPSESSSGANPVEPESR